MQCSGIMQWTGQCAGGAVDGSMDSRTLEGASPSETQRGHGGWKRRVGYNVANNKFSVVIQKHPCSWQCRKESNCNLCAWRRNPRTAVREFASWLWVWVACIQRRDKHNHSAHRFHSRMCTGFYLVQPWKIWSRRRNKTSSVVIPGRSITLNKLSPLVRCPQLTLTMQPARKPLCDLGLIQSWTRTQNRQI